MTRGRSGAFETALVAGGFAVLFLCLPHQLFGDDYVRFDDIERLLHSGELSDSRYSLVMPLPRARRGMGWNDLGARLAHLTAG